MRPGLAFTLYFAAVFLGGALLAPWLHLAVQGGAEVFPALQTLADKPFHRFVNRAFMVLGVVALFPLFRHLRLRGRSELGFPRGAEVARPLGAGLLFGFGSLAVAALLALSLGAREWRSDLTVAGLAGHALNAGVAAVAVSLIEEFFFRGVLFGGLRRGMRWEWALGASAAVYALLHFFQRPPRPEVVEWWSGLATLGMMLRGLVQVELLVPGFLTLTLAGLMLGWAYQKTGALYFSLGLHAGWVFWLKTCNHISRPAEGPSWFWGTGKLLDGWMAFIVMALAAGGLAWFLGWTERRKTNQNDRAALRESSRVD